MSASEPGQENPALDAAFPDAAPEATCCAGCGRVSGQALHGLCGACLLRGALDDVPPDAADAPLAEWHGIRALRVGNCQLLDEIARGGMGIVYRARQSRPERVVALKMMLPWLANSPPMVERFRAEANAAAQLDHPGILQVYEVGEYDGVPYFTMRFAEGGSLQQRLAGYRGNWTAIAALLAQLARAVHHAHVRGILHRDLKPGNVLFSQDGLPLIADFGLAKWRAVEHNLTLPSSVLGSPHYMAPEQVSGQFGGVGPPTDVYGLGAILYELLTGRPPLEADDAVAALRRVISDEPRPPRELEPRVPRTLQAIALKCLAKNPLDRYPSAEALAHDVESWLADEDFSVHGPAERTRRFSRQLVAAAALFSVIVLATAWWIARAPGAPASAGYVTAAPNGAALRAIRAVAVLPFDSDARDAANVYLGLALRDATVAALSDAGGLRAVAADAVAGGSDGTARLAATLQVEAVVEGRIARDGAQLALELRLRRAADGATLWTARAIEAREELLPAAAALAAQLVAALGQAPQASVETMPAPATARFAVEPRR